MQEDATRTVSVSKAQFTKSGSHNNNQNEQVRSLLRVTKARSPRTLSAPRSQENKGRAKSLYRAQQPSNET